MSFMELLAPAGTLETYRAALDSGADAVYVGAPGLNARSLAKDLRMDEVGAMIQHCHSLNKRIYIAANSLVLEKELETVVNNLALLSELQPDALIVQDFGLLRLVKKYFPGLKIHASTLMTAHNSEAVQFFGERGCERVVLARELTLKEIEIISKKAANTELEVFVHGAMCFSYSGLCLFSSYLGGKSGLRGRCVQPCRRGYTSGAGGPGKKRGDARPKRSGNGGGKSKYLFSMNDLSGIEAVPTLESYGISSLKIEGRLRSAHYVRCVVGAYRLILDAPEDCYDEALLKAQELAAQAMSRKTSAGYFFSAQPETAISPYHSGNIGMHLGKFSAVKMVHGQPTCRFTLKTDLEVGDRLRLHVEPSGERTAMRLKSLYVQGKSEKKGSSGNRVSIGLPPSFLIAPGSFVEVYKVDSAPQTKSQRDELKIEQVAHKLRKLRKRLAPAISPVVDATCTRQMAKRERVQHGVEKRARKGVQQRGVLKEVRKKLPVEWWLKTDSLKMILNRMVYYPDRYLLSFEKQLLGQAGKIKKSLGRRSRLVSWALPPIIMENDLERVKKQIGLLMRTGFRSFQIGHVSQLSLFQGERVHIFGGYSLNAMNSQAVMYLKECGIEAMQAAIELDRDALRDLLEGLKRLSGRVPVGLCVYGAPALYTARLAPKHFEFEKKIESPRKEPYIIRKKEGLVQTFPERPFSLLPYLEEIRDAGVSYVVVDTCNYSSQKYMEELTARLGRTGRYRKLSTFNYLGRLE